ncbi:MAG TPA: sugar ABC transporter substrate-binding protein [Steroidobacteraceae bacterium]|jgi:multiple sugar transport system substrate-binding protein
MQRASVNRRAVLAGLAGLATTTLGCTARRSGKAHVRFWAVGREGDIAEQLIREFTAQNPDIEVEVQKLPWTAAHEKLLTAYAGETLPDVCQLGNTWVPEFAALNALHPLDDFIKQSPVVTEGDYFQGFFDANRVRSVVYGVPWYVDTRLMFYRRDLLQQAGFDAPPRTWSEWSRMLGAIKSMVGRDRYSVLLPLNEFEPLLVLALQQPDEVLRDQGRWGNFRSADFRRALEYYNQMFARGWAPRATNTEISNVWDEFGRGYFSFYISGPWNIAEFKKRLPPNLQDAWMTAPMPGPDGPGVSSAGGATLVVFRSSPYKAQAWRLIEYLSRPETQRRFYELTGDMPPRRATWKLPVLAQSVYAKAFHEQLDRVRSPPKVPEWERIAMEMRLAAERVVQRASTVDEAVTALDAKVDMILEKRRWMLDHGRYA